MPRKPSLKKLYEKHLLAILAADAAHTEAFVKGFPPGYDEKVKRRELFASIDAARKELIERLTKPLDNSK